jgi:hypothetical protein
LSLRRDCDHSKLGCTFLLFLGRKIQITCDEVSSLCIQMFVKDDLVHGLCKVDVDLIKKSCCVR